MITQKQRDDYRYALEDKGVPEVIAFMAAQALNAHPFGPDSPAFCLISGGFDWSKSADGNGFWAAVEHECEYMESLE